MTSSADAESGVPTKQTFVVWAPDRTDPDALSRRLAVRAEHLERVRRLTAEGLIRFGGPMADPANADKFNGSLLVFEAESAAAVRAVVEQDIYWAQNVWDKEKLDIRAVLIAFNGY